MDLVHSLQDRLLFAVPKKGRLHQPCLDVIQGSDINFHRHNRLDIALVKNLPIALVFLPAADIPTFVGEGRVDLGITGRDQVLEHEAVVPPTETTGVTELLDLDFGRCKLQVQVPEKGSIQKPEELLGKNIVSSFTNLATKYFRDLETGLTNGDKEGGNTTIKYVGGSVEAACALGVADGIVDLVGRCTTYQGVVMRLTRHRVRRDNASCRPQSHLDRGGEHGNPHPVKKSLAPRTRQDHLLKNKRLDRLTQIRVL
jgi:ATP phosphoribosyltransferase